MQTAEQHFQFTEDEIEVLRKHPAVLACLMDHHEARQTEADAIADGDFHPRGNAIRKQAIYERGRSIMAEDLDVWPDSLRRAFGFPAFAATPDHK